MIKTAFTRCNTEFTLRA